MFKIKIKDKKSPYIGTYFKMDQRYYKIYAVDKEIDYLHMYGDNFNIDEVMENFGTTINNWGKRCERGDYILVNESEVPQRILNYKLIKNYDFQD
jgi:hypothetical protein